MMAGPSESIWPNPCPSRNTQAGCQAHIPAALEIRAALAAPRAPGKVRDMGDIRNIRLARGTEPLQADPWDR